MKAGRAIGVVVALYAVGAIVGALGDQIHVQFGALSYPRPHPWLFGQAWWVPFNFGLAVLPMVLGYGVTARLVGDRERLPRRAVIVPALVFYAAYFSTGMFFGSPRALTAGLVLAWLVRVIARPHRGEVVTSLLLAVAGPGYEAALAALGLFSYARPDFIVPMWLPALYLHLGPMVRAVYLGFIAAPGAPAATSERAPYLSLKNLDQ